MHWKSLSRPKFEMVNGGGLLQVPTAFSGRYVEFVQSSAFGQLLTLVSDRFDARGFHTTVFCVA